MKTASTYLKEIYGCKVYRIALSADVTCPNRDGTRAAASSVRRADRANSPRTG